MLPEVVGVPAAEPTPGEEALVAIRDPLKRQLVPCSKTRQAQGLPSHDIMLGLHPVLVMLRQAMRLPTGFVPALHGGMGPAVHTNWIMLGLCHAMVSPAS